MKRDMGVVRQILIAIEDSPPGQFTTFETSGVEGISRHDFAEYARLLKQAGFIEHANVSSSGAAPGGLTWEGHDFLAAIRSDTIWNKMKSKLIDLGMTVPWEIVKAVGMNYAKEQFKA